MNFMFSHIRKTWFWWFSWSFLLPVLALVFDALWHRFWPLLAALGIHWHPFRISFPNLCHSCSIKGAFGGAFFILTPIWIRFDIILTPFGSHLVSFLVPLAPFGFIFPPNRGSPWNPNAFSYHVLRFWLRHVHAHNAVAEPRLCRAIDTYIYIYIYIDI